MAKEAQILIRVEQEKKEKWKKEAQEQGFRGLSGFVRFAVGNEIDGRDDAPTERQSVDAGEIEDAVSRALQEHDETVDQRLAAIEATLETVQEDIEGDEGGTVARDMLIGHIPNVDLRRLKDDAEEYDNPSKRYRRPTDDEIREEAKTPDEIADDIGVPTPPVRRTLEQMALKSERVYSHETESGQRRYFVNV